MSVRSTRRAQSQAPLTNQESLLLAQAVWEVGAGPNSWASVAKLLSKHPLLSRPKSFFNAQSCHSLYEQLMKDAELEVNEANHIVHAPLNRKLAEKHYRSRHTELRDLILAEESKFKTVLKEIEDIRVGLWDKQIQGKLTGELPTETPTEPIEQEGLSAVPTSDEVFDGSDVSGATESPETSSSPRRNKDDTTPVNLEKVEQQPRVEIPSTVVADEEQTQHDATPSSPPISHNEVQEAHHKSPFPSVPTENDEIVPNSSGAELVAESIDEAIPSTEDVEAYEPESEPIEGVDEPAGNEVADSTSQHADQRQEEEEEEIAQDEESKEEEEEEASQGHQEEDIRMNTEHDDDENAASSNSTEHIEVETESDPPAPTIQPSETEPAADEADSSESEEEPVVPTRRSSRRRKSSAASIPPPKTRKRLRSQGRMSTDRQIAMESDEEDEAEAKEEETPQPEDEQTSSPYEGTMTRRGKRKASFLESVDSPMDKKRLREDSEPAEEEESGPSSHNTRARVTRHATRTEEQVALKRFQNVIGMLHSQISQHRNGNIFHNPIKNSEAPDYHEIVKRPMDLKTIKTRVKDGVIANSLEFQRDIFLMFANAMMYNRPGSDVHAMAEDMMLESEGQINAFRQTEGLVKRGQRP